MLTIDASVWVAAADRRDHFFAESRDFLQTVVHRRLRIILPAFARVEIACALARRNANPVAGRVLANALLSAGYLVEIPLDAQVLAHALRIGTRGRLRGADALYAATAARYHTRLIAWDAELNQRAGGITPTAWMGAVG
jgi:predicted nucleic acid-binding protein